MRQFDSIEKIAAFAEEQRDHIAQLETDDPILLLQRVYKLWWHWADLTIFIISPTIPVILPPVVILPEALQEGGGDEFVYPIHDHGYKLSTSKAEDMYSAGDSMCRLYYTIEKMVRLLLDRLMASGIVSPDDESDQTEVQVAFAGHELAQRKAFETIINLKYNVVVTNFEPGEWGDRYLEIVKRLASRGYGYPAEAPRDMYRHSTGAIKSKPGR